MKFLNLFVITLLSIFLIFTTSCEKDDGNQYGVGTENCDESPNCNDKSCARMLDIRDDILCVLDGDNDVDWYAYIVTENDVSNNSGNYSFNFINESSFNIKVDLFLNGVAEGKVLTSGNGDGIYEAGLDLTGSITFKEAGTYYLKISRESGNAYGTYKIRIN